MNSQEMNSRSKRTKSTISLEELTSNFLNMYGGLEDGCLIGIDDSAVKLGVKRRKIHEVLTILKSTGLVGKEGQKSFRWFGFGAVHLRLKDLKEQGMKEKLAIIPYVPNSVMVVTDKARAKPLELDFNDPPKPENKKKKIRNSIALLAQNFLKLFLCSNHEYCTLSHRAVINALYQNHDIKRKSLERRIEDIGYIMSAIKLVAKIREGTKKPVYRWLGHIPTKNTTG